MTYSLGRTLVTSPLLSRGTCRMSFVTVKGACSYMRRIPRLHHLPTSPMTLSQAFRAHHSVPLRPASTWQICVEMKPDHPQEGLSQCPVHTMGSMKVTLTGIGVFLPFSFYIYLFMRHLLFVCFFFGCGMWDLAPCQGLNLGPLCWEHGVLATRPQGRSQAWLSTCVYSFLT